MRPGTIHCPETSRFSTHGGSAARAAGVARETDRIRPSETTRRAFESGGAPVPSTSVAPRKATTAKSTTLTGDRSLFFELLFGNLDRVHAREAGGAGRLEGAPEGLEH